MTAVHRHEIDVGVDKQIAFGGAAVQVKRFLVSGLADLDHSFIPLGVVVVVAIGIELVVNLRAHHALHFPWRHFPVQGIGDDDVYVVNAITGQHIEHNLEDGLANVGRGHGRQGQADVINSDGYLHTRLELGEQGIASKRVIQRVSDRCLAIGQAFERRIRVQHARADGQVLENKVFARRHDARRAVAIDIDNRFVCFAS